MSALSADPKWVVGMSATPPAASSAKAGGRDGKFKLGAAPKGKPFEKGRSGNPKGTSALQAEVKALALSHSTEAIETLVTLMRSKDTKVSLAAAIAILDRGLGRPVQAIETNTPLVSVNINEPIRDAAAAADAYRQIVGDPTFDFSRVTFASPAPPALEFAAPAELLPALPPTVVQEPPAAPPVQTMPQTESALERRLAAAEQRASDEAADSLRAWRRLGE